ncbi:MAG: PqqD family protein [bacterium]
MMKIYKLSDNFSLHNDENGYMLFDTGAGNIYKLNEVSFKILSLCDGNKTDKDIKDIILNLFDVSAEIFSNDFDNITKVFLDKHFITCAFADS